MSLASLTLAAVFVAACALASPAAMAAGDMLTPDEVQTTGIEANPANDSGLFIGGGMKFGQARTTEGGSSPGFGVLFGVEPGYQFKRGSWSRFELSAEALFGTMSFRTDDSSFGKVDLPVGFGLLVKGGYGYSLGDKAYGLLKVGIGPTMAKLKGSGSGGSYESSGTLSGIAAMFGWDMVMPLGSAMDGTLGIDWLHMQYDVGSVKLSGGGTYDLKRSLIVNMPSLSLGVRVRI